MASKWNAFTYFFHALRVRMFLSAPLYRARSSLTAFVMARAVSDSPTIWVARFSAASISKYESLDRASFLTSANVLATFALAIFALVLLTGGRLEGPDDRLRETRRSDLEDLPEDAGPDLLPEDLPRRADPETILVDRRDPLP